MGKKFKYFPIGGAIVVKVSFWFNPVDEEFNLSEEFKFQGVKVKRIYAHSEGEGLEKSFHKYEQKHAEIFHSDLMDMIDKNELA